MQSQKGRKNRSAVVKIMGLKINKMLHRSSSKKGLPYVDPKLVRDAELAREMAWHDAYLASHGIG